jgi:hypothetical protein
MTIDIGYITKLTAVSIKADDGIPFRIAYSHNAADFSDVKGAVSLPPLIFTTSAKHVSHDLPVPVVARYVQIIVMSTGSPMQLAVELYGSTACQYDVGTMPLGVGSSITNVNFEVVNGLKATQAMNVGLFASGVGLHGACGDANGAWPQQYFQMENDQSWEFRFISTQMRTHKSGFADDAVHTYTVRYSNENAKAGEFTPYTVDGKEVTFRGNDCRTPTTTSRGANRCKPSSEPYRTDDRLHNFGIVTNEFVPSFKAKVVRIFPKSWGRCPVATVEFFVSATKFDWAKADLSRVESGQGSVCDNLWSATAPAWADWSQGLNGDNFVWSSETKLVEIEGKRVELKAYRKQAVKQQSCGKITKEMLCYREAHAGGSEQSAEVCCSRKDSVPLGDCTWAEQASETKIF